MSVFKSRSFSKQMKNLQLEDATKYILKAVIVYISSNQTSKAVLDCSKDFCRKISKFYSAPVRAHCALQNFVPY